FSDACNQPGEPAHRPQRRLGPRMHRVLPVLARRPGAPGPELPAAPEPARGRPRRQAARPRHLPHPQRRLRSRLLFAIPDAQRGVGGRPRPGGPPGRLGAGRGGHEAEGSLGRGPGLRGAGARRWRWCGRAAGVGCGDTCGL
ncbi:hypothetical protein SLS62_003346, partial [Diatrype stigma]